MTPQPQHIIQLTAENVKRIKAIQITPDGKTVVVGGKNGAGKSSVLDCIAMALQGADAVPSTPVRRGEAKKLQALIFTAESKSVAIATLDDTHQKALAEANFPVPDLTLGDDEILYKGLSLAQAASAEQLRVGLAIAIAANPVMKIMLIHDGSLLDDESMAIVAQMANDHNCQVWLEKVSSDAGECSVIIEDGMIQEAKEGQLL